MVSGDFIHNLGQKVVVIEYCEGCQAHAWNTRHDEAKYESFAAGLEADLKEMIPGLTVFKNQVPEQFVFSDHYTQLMQGAFNVYDIKPRVGAFEVSTVIIDEQKTQIKRDVLFYSKLMCMAWPH